MSQIVTALTPASGGGFFVCDVLSAIPKDDLASMEHPLFSLSTRPDCRILNYTHNDTEITVTPSVKWSQYFGQFSSVSKVYRV